MSRRVKELVDMEIDEISLVDRPANAHAKVVISKSEGGAMPEDLYDEDGNILDVDAVDVGDVVFDEDGEAFLLVEDEVTEAEPELVGKSFAEELREEISKAAQSGADVELISKMADELDYLRYQAEESEMVAKSERDMRLVGDYYEVAKSYGVPVDPEELAPVLLAIAENLPYEYGAVIHKALTVSGEVASQAFDEIGFDGQGTNNDVLYMVDSYIDENIAKTDYDISKAEAVSAVFEANPGAYDEYMATRY